MRTTASRVAAGTGACFSSSAAMCWRKSSVDHSVLAAPTIVRSGGSSCASASCATAGMSSRLVRSPEAPKITIRSSMGPPFLGSGARVRYEARRSGTSAYRGEGRPVTPGRQRKIAPASGCVARCSQSIQEVVM